MIFLQPHSLDELAAALRHCAGTPALLAGCTDFLARRNGAAWSEETVIDLLQIPELRDIRADGDSLFIGATCTHDCAAYNAEAAARFPALAQACAGVGSWQIRNRGTLGGSVCNASPAGDMMPVSLLYDAELETLDGEGTVTRIPVRDFVLAPRKTVLQPRQAVTAVVIDASRFRGCISAFHKIGSRERVSISRIGLASLVRLDGDRTIAEARMTLGAVANTPIRVPEAEERMLHRRLDEDALLTEVTAIVSKTVHDNCRPTNRLYKTEASRGLTADLFSLLLSRED